MTNKLSDRYISKSKISEIQIHQTKADENKTIWRRIEICTQFASICIAGLANQRFSSRTKSFFFASETFETLGQICPKMVSCYAVDTHRFVVSQNVYVVYFPKVIRFRAISPVELVLFIPNVRIQ